MTDGPYGNRKKEELILRDYLAVERTMLANERTLLAYIRTALTLFVAGVSFIKFFGSAVLALVGWIFVPLGVTIIALGLMRYRKVRYRLP